MWLENPEAAFHIAAGKGRLTSEPEQAGIEAELATSS
jgi:hypothetical protein